MTSCQGRPGYLPKFQPQNPAISGDRYGWVNCTAYAAAMAADFDTCGKVGLTGERVRSLSDEPIPDKQSPGLNLRQVDDALNRYGVDLETRYRLPWADFARRINKGEGAILQGSTGPFLSTKFRSTAGDINHAIYVPPGWGAIDPAADGRQSYHRYDGAPYPEDLLRRFAGRLELVPNVRLGLGLVYAAFTRDRRSTWTWERDPKPPATRVRFRVFAANEATRTITGRRWEVRSGTNPRQCTPPRLYRDPVAGGSKSLVRMLEGAFAGDYVMAQYATEVP